jgi:hypothetical protein
MVVIMFKEWLLSESFSVDPMYYCQELIGSEMRLSCAAEA